MQPVYLASRFPRTWKGLTGKHKERVIDILIVLPDLLKNPHQHSGFGFRRLQGSQFYEARLDIRWRLILRVDPDEIVLFDVMNHDEVRRLSR